MLSNNFYDTQQSMNPIVAQTIDSRDSDNQVLILSPRLRTLQSETSASLLNRTSVHSAYLENVLDPIYPSQTAATLTSSNPQMSFPSPSLNCGVDCLQPCRQGEKVLCRIVRKKEKGKPIVYQLVREQDNLIMLEATRNKFSGKGSTYFIFNGGGLEDKNNLVGKVRSNFLGTQFNIYDSGISPNKFKRNKVQPNNNNSSSREEEVESYQSDKEIKLRQELGTVFYEPNLLGLKGPRKMTILLMGMTKEGQRPEFRPVTEREGLVSKYKSSERQLLVLNNKVPQWNEDSQSYVLNFNGRVTLASVKNFQIVHCSDLDYLVLQFGRVAEDRFSLDYQYPLCPLQAFAIALSSFDAKLACE